MDAEELKQLVVEAIDDLKGVDVKVLDVSGKTSVTDIIVIAGGASDRQVKALARSVVDKVKERGIQPLGVEGEREGEWVLVDLGDVVVHLMLPQVRDFYNLEKLWGESAPDATDAERS